MSATSEKLSLQCFRETYAERKPNFELINGTAFQKALPTKLHSILQFVLAVLLKELGFKARPELTLAMGESWQPTPDVCGILGREEDPYPTHAVAVAIEILSPDDRLTRIVEKCGKYAEWGVADILVFDPVSRKAWHWNFVACDLSSIEDRYEFSSRPAQLILAEVFRRLDDELS